MYPSFIFDMDPKIYLIPTIRKSDSEFKRNIVTKPVLFNIVRDPPPATHVELSPPTSTVATALQSHSIFITCPKPRTECPHYTCPKITLDGPSKTASIQNMPENTGAFFLALAFKGLPGLKQPKRIAMDPFNPQVGDDGRGLDARPNTRIHNGTLFRIFLKQGPPSDAEMKELAIGLHLYREHYHKTMKGIFTNIPDMWWDQLARLHLIQSRIAIRRKEGRHGNEEEYVAKIKKERKPASRFRSFTPSYLGPGSAVNAATGTMTAPKLPAKCHGAHRRSPIREGDIRGTKWGRMSKLGKRMFQYRWLWGQIENCEAWAEAQGKDAGMDEERGQLAVMKYGIMSTAVAGDMREELEWMRVARVKGFEDVECDVKMLMKTSGAGLLSLMG
jgi:hypothetical protein